MNIFLYILAGHILAQVLLSSAVAITIRGDGDVVYRQTQRINNGIVDVDIGFGCLSASTYRALPSQRKVFVVENPLANFISLHFTHLNLMPKDYITITPTTGSTSANDETLIYSGAKSLNGFFTKTLHVNSVTIEFVHTTIDFESNLLPPDISVNSDCYGFQIDKYHYLAQPGKDVSCQSSQEEVCGEDDTREAACYHIYPQAYQHSKAVGRLLVHKPEGSIYCTIWLFGCEGHLLTNHHCISEPVHAQSAEVEFDAQGPNCNTACDFAGACPGMQIPEQLEFITANEVLDYSLVKIPAQRSNGPIWQINNFLQLRESGPILLERIYIPQHPSGYGKRIAIKSGAGWGSVDYLDFIGCAEHQIAYSLDTRSGASGSPVIAWKDNSVVALHRCGGCPNAGTSSADIVRNLRELNLLPQCAVSQ